MTARPRYESLNDRILEVLTTYVSGTVARSVLRLSADRCGERIPVVAYSPRLEAALLERLKRHCPDRSKLARCRDDLRKRFGPSRAASRFGNISVDIEGEENIVLARRMVKKAADEVGFNYTTQISLVTVVSELSRNIWRYAGRGTISIAPTTQPKGIRVVAVDRGPGIPNLKEIMTGNYKSRTGMGLGLIGCKRLTDRFSVDTGPGKGTTVTVFKAL